MKLYIIKAVVTLTFIAGIKASNAQQYQTIVEELQKIKGSYTDTGYMSFNVHYQYAKKSSPDTPLDAVTANYKCKSGKFYFHIGPIEFIQSDSVNIAIYEREKIMVVSNSNSYNATKQAGVLIGGWDSAFIAQNIDSFSLSANGANKILQFSFKPNAAFLSGSIEYASNYHPIKLTYSQAGHSKYNEDLSAGDEIIVSILFSNYDSKKFDESVFDITKFVTRREQLWVPNPAYAGYKFMNNYSNKR